MSSTLAIIDRHIQALQDQIDYYKSDRKWTLQTDRWRAIRDYLKVMRIEIAKDAIIEPTKKG